MNRVKYPDPREDDEYEEEKDDFFIGHESDEDDENTQPLKKYSQKSFLDLSGVLYDAQCKNNNTCCDYHTDAWEVH